MSTSPETKTLEGIAFKTPRARIIAAAVEEFSLHGYRGTKLPAVAKRARVSEAEFGKHFGSKESLLAAALTRRDATVRLQVWDGEAGIGWRGIEAWVELMRNNERRPGTVSFFAELRLLAAQDDHPAHDWLRGHHQLVDEVVERAVRTGIERGEIKPGTDPARLALGLLAMIEGLETRWVATHGEFDPVAAMAEYVALLKTSIGTEELLARDA